MIGQARTGNRRPLIAALAACLALLPAGGASAQSDEPPSGRALTLSVGAGLTATDDPEFVVNPSGSEVRASTDLHLRFRSDTALSRLVLEADTLLLLGLSGEDTGFERPRQGIHLGYGRDGAATAWTFDASLRESRIDFLRPLLDFVNEDGEIVLPDDLDDLRGEGWRRQTSLDTSLTLGRDAPFGAVLGAGFSDVSYRDTSNAALEDSERHHASLRLRFDLTPVTRLDLAMRYGLFKDSTDRRETWSLSPGLSFDRPDGTIRATLSATRTEDGTRLSAEIGRVIARPWGDLDLRIGGVRLAGGDTALSGGLRMNYMLRQGRLTLALDRAAVSGNNDDETLRTALSVSYQQALSDLSSLSLSLAYVKSDNSATGLATDTASFGLGYSHALSRDWSVNLGYNHRMRDRQDSGRSTENTVSVTFSRSLTFGL